jgi:hypothetical protein
MSRFLASQTIALEASDSNTLVRTARLPEFQVCTLAYPMVLEIVHADDTPPILPYAKLSAEQTIFRPQLFKNEMLAWAICIRINQRSARIGERRSWPGDGDA